MHFRITFDTPPNEFLCSLRTKGARRRPELRYGIGREGSSYSNLFQRNHLRQGLHQGTVGQIPSLLRTIQVFFLKVSAKLCTTITFHVKDMEIGHDFLHPSSKTNPLNQKVTRTRSIVS